MEWEIQSPEFGLQGGNPGSGFDLTVDSEGAAEAKDEPLPPPVEESGLPTSVEWALAAVVALVLGILFRRLYFDNVFGRRYTFPSREVKPRLGGSYTGGLGASVSLDRKTSDKR